MSLAAIWDRFWWSLMLTIFIGLVWLKFIDPLLPHIIIGIVVSIIIGAIYFITGMRKMMKIKRLEEEIDRKAREDLVAEFEEEGKFCDRT